MKNFFFLKAATIMPLLDGNIRYWHENDFENFHELNREYFTRMHQAWDKEVRWGSSNNLQILYIDLIWRWYPKAEFIFLARDPRDNWSSFRSHLHPRSMSGEWDHWELFVDRFRRIRKIMKDLRDDPRTYTVEYHEVVHNPLLVYEMLGIEPPENYLENADIVLLGRSYGLTTPEALQVVRDKIITTRVGRWKRDLSEEEVRKCTEAFPEECAYYDGIDTA
jgi:hypothetical protein